MNKLIVTLLGFFFAISAFAKINPNINYYTTKSDHFAIHHTIEQKQLAKEVAAIAEAIYPKLQKKLNWTPTGTIHIVLDDGKDYPNGFTQVFTQNHITLFLTPPLTINNLENTNHYLYLLIEHELVHAFHLEKNKDGFAEAQKIFGRSPLFFPAFFTPMWIKEGLATHYETHKEENVGRGISATFQALFRDEYLNGFKRLDQINQATVRTLPVGTARYLYGVFFIDYLAQTYGEDKITEWVENYSGNIIPFQINSNAQTVFGKDLFQLYDDFIVERSQFYKKQIAQIKKTGLSKTKQLPKIPNQSQFVANKHNLNASKRDAKTKREQLQKDNAATAPL
jgi:hypothetical protein